MAVKVDVQLRQQGRVVIPSNIRRKYDLKDGDWIKVVLLFESDDVCKEAIIAKAKKTE
ncbi:MAG: AbrB/MazE/SpoVT family DNA-binding domain-containing protein [Asgard group archaeon]|nr:AbrB/MazE/SpoVT family DNA-binding domain-containing protein [Asgard group archaeon]